MAVTFSSRNLIDFRVTEDSIEVALDRSMESHTMSIDDAEQIVRLASSLKSGETLRLDSVTVTRGAPSGDTDDDPKVTFGDRVQSTPNPTVYVSDIEDAVDIADEIGAPEDDLTQYSGEVVVATCASYGAVVPVDVDYKAETKDGELTFFFNADDDLSGDRFDSWEPLHRDYDSAAYVNTIKQLSASEAGDEL